MQIRHVGKNADFRTLADIWNTALKQSASDQVFITFEWFRSWWDNLAERRKGKPYELDILVFQESKNPQDTQSRSGPGTLFGIAPLVRRGSSLYFLASQEISDYCDFIFPQGREHRFFGALLSFLKSDLPGIQKLELINIPAASPTLDDLPRMAEDQGWLSTVRESEETPVLHLPASYEDYLSGLSRRNRHELRRKVRKAASLQQVKTEKYVRPDDISSRIKDFIQLHKQSSPDKERFWEKPGMEGFFFDVARSFAEKRWLELRFLYMQDQIVAALLSFVYGGVLSFYNMAFNQEFAAFNPGYYLFDWSLREAIAGQLAAADFLRGSERYKYEFGAQKGKIYNLILKRGVTSE